MACVRRRRGVWVLDQRIHGRRVVKAYRAKRLALAALKKLGKQNNNLHPACDPLVSVRDYAPRFLADCLEAEAAPRTLETYRAALDTHILPMIGSFKVADVTRSDVRGLLLALGREAVSLTGRFGNIRRRGVAGSA